MNRLETGNRLNIVKMSEVSRDRVPAYATMVMSLLSMCVSHEVGDSDQVFLDLVRAGSGDDHSGVVDLVDGDDMVCVDEDCLV